MTSRRRLIQLSGGALAAAAIGRSLPAMAQPSTPPSATPAVELGDVTSYPTKQPGKLVIHCDEPVYEPWYVDDDPTNGKGFEGGFAKALWTAMGYTEDQVEWGRTSFNQSYAPGEKPFDVYITEVSRTPDRERAVGFTQPYHASPLVTVTKQESEVLQATSIADLRKYKFGTQVGTTFQTYIEEVIKPEQDLLVYDTNADSLTALENDTVDLVLQTLEIGIFNTTVQFDDMALGGLLPDSGQEICAVTEKDSPLLPYLDAAIIQLWNDGTIHQLEEDWLTPPEGLQTYTT